MIGGDFVGRALNRRLGHGPVGAGINGEVTALDLTFQSIRRNLGLQIKGLAEKIGAGLIGALTTSCGGLFKSASTQCVDLHVLAAQVLQGNQPILVAERPRFVDRILDEAQRMRGVAGENICRGIKAGNGNVEIITPRPPTPDPRAPTSASATKWLMGSETLRTID